jgi:hypothetical protein
LSESERAALSQACEDYTRQLLADGRCIDFTRLSAGKASSATTIRAARSGEVSVTDGPFTETKEQLGGIMILDVPDLNDAIRIMTQAPGLHLGGGIEIRPIA